MPCLGDRIAAPSCLDCDREGGLLKKQARGNSLQAQGHVVYRKAERFCAPYMQMPARRET